MRRTYRCRTCGFEGQARIHYGYGGKWYFCASCESGDVKVTEICTRCDEGREAFPQIDGWGIEAGYYCEPCWEQSSIRRNTESRKFDPAYAGESLEEDY